MHIISFCMMLTYREAAKECRRKKKEYIKCLENRVAVLENQNKALIDELKTLKELYCKKSEWANIKLYLIKLKAPVAYWVARHIFVVPRDPLFFCKVLNICLKAPLPIVILIDTWITLWTTCRVPSHHHCYTWKSLLLHWSYQLSL